MQFESKTTQFISTYYFETKARDEDKYKSIVRIFAAGIYFPCATFLVFGYLAFYYSEWIARLATKFIKGYDKNEQQTAMFVMPHVKQYCKEAAEKLSMSEISCDSETKYDSEANHASEHYHKIFEKNRRIRIIVSLSIASILLSFALLAFHIIASVKLIQYGNEVLYDDNDDQGYNLSKDDQCVPIVYVVFSFLPPVSLILMIFAFLMHHATSSQQSNSKENILGLILQSSLGAFLVYLGFYFLPYMLLSFIHDPIQSALVYMMLSSVILSICIFTYVCASAYKATFMRHMDMRYRLRTIGHLTFTFASGLSITYFLTILILILALGNLHDFQGVELLSLSLFLGLLSIFLLKPSLVRVKSIIKKDPTKDKYENLDEHKS